MHEMQLCTHPIWTYITHLSPLKGIVLMSSAAELKSIAHYGTLPHISIVGCQSFPPHLPAQYCDATGAEHDGKPDALCVQPRAFTFIECKSGRLNHQPNKAASHWALQSEYARVMHDGRDHPYNFHASYFHHARLAFLLANAWNQSLWKVLALQQLHGWMRYIVCFASNPSAVDAARYCAAGLVFCTDASLARLLATIELAAHGVYYPFRLDATRSGYTVTIHPGPELATA